MNTENMPGPTSTASPQTSLVKDLKAGGAKAENALQEAGQAVADGLVATRRAMSESACSAANATHDYVRANPWKIVGFAAAAGVFIGTLISRR